jgi:hypothetical protein
MTLDRLAAERQQLAAGEIVERSGLRIRPSNSRAAPAMLRKTLARASFLTRILRRLRARFAGLLYGGPQKPRKRPRKDSGTSIATHSA